MEHVEASIYLCEYSIVWDWLCLTVYRFVWCDFLCLRLSVHKCNTLRCLSLINVRQSACQSVSQSAYMKSQHWIISDHLETNSAPSTLPYHKTPPPSSSSHTYVRTSGESVLRNGRRSWSTCTVWVVRRPGHLNRNKDYRTNSDLILWFKFCTVERLEEIKWLTFRNELCLYDMKMNI